MLRIVGCALILCAGALGRQAIAQGVRREEKRMRLCMAAIAQMELEVRLALTPMATIMEKLAQAGEMADYFARIHRGLQNGQTLCQAWEAALPHLRLGTETEDVMRALGQRLSGDEDSVCRSLGAAERALEELCLHRREQWREKRRLGGALCFSAAVLTIIVLL